MINVLLNEDIGKLVVEITDRHHYLTVLEADDLLQRLARLNGLPLDLQERSYPLKAAQVAELTAAIEAVLPQAVERFGRPAPPANAQAEISRLTAENEELKRRMAEWEATHPEVAPPAPTFTAGKGKK